MKTKTMMRINGMTCKHCQRTVTEAISSLKGVENVEVSLENKSAVITFDSELTDSEIIKQAVQASGYETIGEEKMHGHKADHPDYNDHTEMKEENIDEIEHDHRGNHNEHVAHEDHGGHHGGCCGGVETFREKGAHSAHSSHAGHGGYHGGCCGGFGGCGMKMWILIGIAVGLLWYFTN